MDVIEYLLFIPLLIYGIALSRLLGAWKQFFDIEHWHWPFILTIVVFTEVAVWNIYTFLDVFTRLDTHTYAHYLQLLAPPFVFLLSVNALLVDEDHDGLVDPQEFRDRIRLSYFLMGCFVGLHFMPWLNPDDDLSWVRAAAVAVLFVIAWRRDERLVYLLTLIWAIGVGHRLLA